MRTPVTVEQGRPESSDAPEQPDPPEQPKQADPQ